MPAFEHAVDLGYRYLETDVHVTADGVLLAFHDDRARPRHRPHRRRSPSCRGARCSEARVDGREPIPLLEDLLGAWPDVRVNIDPKHDARRRAAGRGVARTGSRRPRVRRRRSATGASPGCDGCSGRALCTSLGPGRSWPGSRRVLRACRRRRLAGAVRAGADRYGGAAVVDRRVRRRPPTGSGCRSTCGRSTTRAEMDAPARPRRRRDHDRPPHGAEGRARRAAVGRVAGLTVELPLTPLDFLARARRLFPDAGRRRRRTTQRWTYARVRRALRPAGPRPAATSSACARATGWRGCAATPTSCSRRTTACCSPAPCCCRSTSGWRRPSCGPSSTTAARRCSSATPTSPTPAHPVRTVVARRRATRRCWRRSRRRPSPAPEVDERPPAELFYTSGCTGAPKGALLTHRGLYLHAVHSRPDRRASRATTSILHTIPLFHVNGWGTPHYVTGLGGVHVLLPRFDAGEVLRLVEERAGHPPVPRADDGDRRCSTHPTLDRRDLSSLVQISIGGAPTPPSLLAEVEAALRVRGICGYGMTESSPHAHPQSLDKPGEPPVGGAGGPRPACPILGVDVRVLGDGDVEVPWDGDDRRRDLRPLEPRDGRLLEAPEATADGAARRLAAHRRRRRRRPRRLPDDRRPHARTSSSPAARTSRRWRSRRCSAEHPAVLESRRRRRGRRALGRGAAGVRGRCGRVAAPAPDELARARARRGSPASRRPSDVILLDELPEGRHRQGLEARPRSRDATTPDAWPRTPQGSRTLRVEDAGGVEGALDGPERGDLGRRAGEVRASGAWPCRCRARR